MTKTSIVGLLVVGLFAAACAVNLPKSAPAPAPAASSKSPAGECGEACAEGCAEGCDDKTMPAPVAKAAAAHELKQVTPSASYPLATCLVTDEELGAVEDRAAFSYEGTEVQFCCPGCAKRFQSDPAKYLAKLAAAKK